MVFSSIPRVGIVILMASWNEIVLSDHDHHINLARGLCITTSWPAGCRLLAAKKKLAQHTSSEKRQQFRNAKTIKNDTTKI